MKKLVFILVVVVSTASAQVVGPSLNAVAPSPPSPRGPMPPPFATASPEVCWNCNFEEEQCYRSHPTDCRKYVKCIRQRGPQGNAWIAMSVWCGFGTFWDQHKYACENSALVRCANDPCQDLTVTSYNHETNCRTYWECKEGVSMAACCAYGQAYVPGQGCVMNDTCNVPCPSIILERPTTTERPACTLRAGDPEGKTFTGNGYSFPMPCAPGTRFKQEDCTCVYGAFQRPACKPGVLIDFDGPLVADKSGRNIYVDAKNINTRKGSGRFVGNSVITVYRYSHAELGRTVFIQLRFYDVDGGPNRQVLVSNCRTKFGTETSPSVAVELDKANKNVVFTALVKVDFGATLSLPYQSGAWNNVELKYDGNELRGTVVTLDPTSGTQTNKVTQAENIKGPLESSVEPLRIGSCNNSDGFVGYIDQVMFYTCIPPEQEAPAL